MGLKIIHYYIIIIYMTKSSDLTVPRRYFFCGSFVFLCLMFLMRLRLFIAALWSPAWKGLVSWLLLMMFIVFFCYFTVWYPGSGVVLDCIVC